MKAKLKLTTDKRTESPTNLPYAGREIMNEEKYNKAYSANHGQACTILQAIQLNGRQKLSPACVEQLAEQVASAWESKSEDQTVKKIERLMNGLLDNTGFEPKLGLNQALVKYCEQEHSRLSSVCPSVSLLVAMDYVGKLKQRYSQIKGTPGCGQRLVLIAYVMASKYIHINLRSIISTSELPSPPTSPTVYSDRSNPCHYHYFKSAQEKQPEYTPVRAPSAAVSRMEIEFLHFLNFDLSLHHTIPLTRWAKNFDDHLHIPLHTPSK